MLLRMNQIPPGGGDDFFAKSMVWMAAPRALLHSPHAIRPHLRPLLPALLSSPRICAPSTAQGTSHQTKTHVENGSNWTRDNFPPRWHFLLETSQTIRG